MKSAFKKLVKRVEEIEKEYGSLETFVTNTTIEGKKHTMRMEDHFLPEMMSIYQDLNDLENADLNDFENLIGRFDGKFS